MSVRLASALLIAAALAAPARADVRAAFAFELADSTGTLSLPWPSLGWDSYAGELYVVDHRDGLVSIFNDSGMRVHAFGDDTSLGVPNGVAALPGGDLLVLSSAVGHWVVERCNFRGELLGPLPISGAPAAFLEGFGPTAIAAVGGRVYLADEATLRVLITDETGAVLVARDLLEAIQPDARKGADAYARGFAVDSAGDLLFTVPVLFQVFSIAPDGKVRRFGTRGSAPGKFNVIAGIAADESGRVYVTDILRAVVMVFESDGRFLGEFGYRGSSPDNLIAPADLVVGGGRVFVTQSRGGLKAFEIVVN